MCCTSCTAGTATYAQALAASSCQVRPPSCTSPASRPPCLRRIARRGAAAPAAAECAALEALLAGIDPQGDLEAFWETAVSAGATGDALSERQAEVLEQIAGELLVSPHILR